jgi:hypothetical protein
MYMSYECGPESLPEQDPTLRTYDPARNDRRQRIAGDLGHQAVRGQQADQQRQQAQRDLGQTAMRGARADKKPERSRER